jgi:hypothetical protein
MPRQPDAFGEFPDSEDIDRYDFTKMQNVVTALDFLRGEAKRTGSEEIHILIDSAFRSVMCTYYLVMRHAASEGLGDSLKEFH